MQTVQTATCKWDHMPARELAQQCFLQSAVYSRSWSSKFSEEKSLFLQDSQPGVVSLMRVGFTDP